MAWREIPYSIEQGNFSAKQGMVSRKQGSRGKESPNLSRLAALYRSWLIEASQQHEPAIHSGRRG
jgi:hypothetical protein